MATYGDMQYRIANEMFRHDLSAADATSGTTIIKQAIVSAIAEHQREHFYFNETAYDTFDAVVDQETYTEGSGGLVSDIIKVVSLSTVQSSRRNPVRRRDWDYIEARQDGAVKSSLVTDFAYFGVKFRMYPIPSQAQTFSLAYVQRVAAPSASGDTGAWVNEAEELIRSAAKRRLYQHVLLDTEKAIAMQASEAAALAALRRETRLRTGTGRIRPTQF
jgi:hypothetical protein